MDDEKELEEEPTFDEGSGADDPDADEKDETDNDSNEKEEIE